MQFARVSESTRLLFLTLHFLLSPAGMRALQPLAVRGLWPQRLSFATAAMRARGMLTSKCDTLSSACREYRHVCAT